MDVNNKEENSNKDYFKNFGINKEDVMKVREYLSEVKEEGYFIGENSIKIYYQKYVKLNEKGRMVISHGFCESIEKYEELIYYFNNMGYSVFCMEHRGHGRSGHLGTIHKSQINVENFQYYVKDLKVFVENYVYEKESNLYLFAHSMGGAIGTLFLEQYPQYFKKAILSSPMLEIDTGKFSNSMAQAISKIFIAMGKGDGYIFGHDAFDDSGDLEASGTSNCYRYKNHLEDLKKNVELQRSGGSFYWINQSIKATKEIFKGNRVEKINIPILLFQSGKDTFVKSEGQDEFWERCKTCKKIKFENGKHELYFENDDILIPYLAEIKEFLK